MTWKQVALSDIATIQSGAGFPLKYQGQQDKLFPFFKVSDMNLQGNEREMYKALNTISEETRKQLGARIFPAGSIVFPKVGGAIATNKKRLIAQNSCVDNNVMGLIPDRAKVTHEYLRHYMQTVDLLELSNKANPPSIRQSTVQDWKIPLPPLPEQKRLVAILDEALAGIDAVIANTEQNLANARALFASYLNGVFSQQGEGWVEKKLGDYSASISTGPFGSLLHKSDYVSTGVPLVNPINIVDRNIVPNKSKMIDEETKKRLQSYVLHEGDVVIARRGEIGRCAVISSVHDGWVCGTGCFFLRPLPAVNPHFLVNLIRSQGYREKLEKAATGTTMKNLSNKTLSSLLIAIPSVEIQTEILANFDKLAGETQRLETIYQQKLDCLAELKQAILHKAFAGELSVLAGKSREETAA